MGFYIYPVREQTRGPQSRGSKCKEGQGGQVPLYTCILVGVPRRVTGKGEKELLLALW